MVNTFWIFIILNSVFTKSTGYVALWWRVYADHSLLASWKIRGEHQILSKCLPSTPASLMINLAQPMIQSMHSLPVVKQGLSNMLLQVFINEGFSAIFCLQITMMANAPRAIDLLADAMASAAQTSTTAPSTFAASRDRALRALGDYIPGTPAHRAKWLNASTLLTGLQAFQVAKARGVLGSPHQVCLHVMGD